MHFKRLFYGSSILTKKCLKIEIKKNLFFWSIYTQVYLTLLQKNSTFRSEYVKMWLHKDRIQDEGTEEETDRERELLCVCVCVSVRVWVMYVWVRVCVYVCVCQEHRQQIGKEQLQQLKITPPTDKFNLKYTYQNTNFSIESK
jgi:hypothetical protein